MRGHREGGMSLFWGDGCWLCAAKSHPAPGALGEETRVPQARVWHKHPWSAAQGGPHGTAKPVPFWAGDEDSIPAPGPGPWEQNTASQARVTPSSQVPGHTLSPHPGIPGAAPPLQLLSPRQGSFPDVKSLSFSPKSPRPPCPANTLEHAGLSAGETQFIIDWFCCRVGERGAPQLPWES